MTDATAGWTASQRREAEVLLAEMEKRGRYRIRRYFPEAGPLRRELYPKHVAFFALGAEKRERLLLAANRIGKTEAGAYELTLHLTGEYDEYAPWWEGRRFGGPVKAWACGDTSTTVRDIVQVALLGPPGAMGTGMIPQHLILHTTSRTGVPGAVETVWVKHRTGGTSTMSFRSYDQRREAFQGTSQHLVWLDEECPDDIYTECLLRTMDTPDMIGGGLLVLTFTPLMGLTPLVLSFLPGGGQATQTDVVGSASKAVVTATWDDAPHLGLEAREQLWASIPPYQRDARSKGIPQLGSGAVYPVGESEITVAPFEVPSHWPRCFGMDTGWNATAAVWLAHDKETQTVYVYSEYKRGQAEIAIHAEAIRARGAWIPGVADAAAITNQDGAQFIAQYRKLGLHVELPDKTVEAGIQDVWSLLSAGS